MVISARRVRPRKDSRHVCAECEKLLGQSAIRLYGRAEPGDRPYVIYLHEACIHVDYATREPKIGRALHA